MKLIFSLFFLTTYGIASPVTEPDTLIIHGLELSYQGRFADAAEVFQRIIADSPDNPAGYFLKAAALESYMSDFSTFEPEEEFHALLDQTIASGKALLEQKENCAESQFFVGAAHFYKGFHSARKKEYFKAFSELARAKPYLEKAASIDSTFNDVYLGLGVLEYLGARTKDYLVPFTSVNYDGAIQMITLATEARYTSVIAQEALVVALAGASRWDEAIERANLLIESYPHNRLFHWALIEIHRRRESAEEVIAVGCRLLQLVENGQPEHYYNQGLVRSYLAEAQIQLGNERECIKQCDSILLLLNEETVDQRDREIREKAIKFKRQAARAIAKKVDR